MELTYNELNTLTELCITTGVPIPATATLYNNTGQQYDNTGQQIYNIPNGVYVATTLGIMSALAERVYGS